MKTEKIEKLIVNLKLKINLKQALNHGLILKKVQSAINFNQKAWLKSYINLNIDLRKAAK